jgi:hypothetical protein
VYKLCVRNCALRPDPNAGDALHLERPREFHFSDPRLMPRDLVWGISGWKDFGIVTPGAARLHGGGHHATKQRVPDLSFVTVFSVSNSCGEFVHTGAVMSTNSDLTAGDAPPVSVSLFLAYADDPVDPGPKSASRPSFHVRGGAEVVVLFRKLTVNGVVPTCFLPKLCGESCSTTCPRSDPPDAAVRRALRVRDDVLLIASEARAEQASKEHSARAYDFVLVLISQLDRAASTELVTWRRDVDSIKPATEQPLVAWAMSMLWDSKGYRMLADLTVFDAAAGTGRAQQPQRHVVSAFVIVSVTLDVSVSFDAHLVRGRVLKTVVPGSLLSSEEEKMDSYTAPMAILARKDPSFFEVLPLALVMGQRTLMSSKPCDTLHSQEDVVLEPSAAGMLDADGWTWQAGHGRVVVILLHEQALADMGSTAAVWANRHAGDAELLQESSPCFWNVWHKWGCSGRSRSAHEVMVECYIKCVLQVVDASCKALISTGQQPASSCIATCSTSSASALPPASASSSTATCQRQHGGRAVFPPGAGVDSGARDLSAGALCNAAGSVWPAGLAWNLFQKLTEGRKVCSIKNMVQGETICHEMSAHPQEHG